MIKKILGGLSLLIALLSAWVASNFFRESLRWWKAPDARPGTLTYLGIQLDGWQIYMPLVVWVIIALAFSIFGLWSLKKRA
jgi:hypothetical protein